MKENLTHIRFVLDRSGSMSLIRESTIAGFNEFVEGQKNTPGECTMTLQLFDNTNPGDIVFQDRPVQGVPLLTLETFVPRDATPLHDAIADAITGLGRTLKAMPETERPAKVIVAIMTDGLENCSRRHSASEVAEMIQHQHETYKWEFLFLGANQDACMTGEKLNIPVANSLTYAATVAGTANALHAMSANVRAYRVTGQSAVMSWTPEQRKEAEGK